MMTTTTRLAIRGKLKILATMFHEQIARDGFRRCCFEGITLTLWGGDSPAHVPPHSATVAVSGDRIAIIDIKDGFLLNPHGDTEEAIDLAIGLVFDETVRKESTDKLN